MITEKDIIATLDSLIGVSHCKRTWFGKITPAEQVKLFGTNFGDRLLRISEEHSNILVLQPSKAGPFKYKGSNYKAVAKFDAISPLKSYSHLSRGICHKAINSLLKSYNQKILREG